MKNSCCFLFAITKRHLAIAVCAFFANGCTTTKAQSRLADTDSQENPCEGSEYAPLTLKLAHANPEAGLPGWVGTIALSSPSLNKNVRLDVCYQEATVPNAILKRVLIFSGSEVPVTLTVGPQDKVEGLDRAIFGETADLRVDLDLTDNTPRRFTMRGWDDFGLGAGIVAYGYRFFSPTFDREVPSGPVTFGTLDFGSPQISSGDCQPGEGAYKRVIHRFKTAEIAADVCWYTEGLSGIFYLYKRIEVTDTNEALTAEEQKTFVLNAGDDANGSFEYTVTHHNESDKFSVKLKHVEYEAEYNVGPGNHFVHRVKYHGGSTDEWICSPMEVGFCAL